MPFRLGICQIGGAGFRGAGCVCLGPIDAIESEKIKGDFVRSGGESYRI